ADRRLEEHHVVARDVLDLRRRDAQELRDVAQPVRREIPLLLLHEIERGKHRRLAPLGRVLRANLLELRRALRRVRERLALLQEHPVGLLEALLVGHQRMKRHRSTSPMTTSVDPMTAMTSAIMPPSIIFGSAWHA